MCIHEEEHNYTFVYGTHIYLIKLIIYFLFIALYNKYWDIYFQIIIPLLSIFAIRATFIDSDDKENVSFRLDMYKNPRVLYSSNDYNYGEKYEAIVENFNGRVSKVDGNVSNGTFLLIFNISWINIYTFRKFTK